MESSETVSQNETFIPFKSIVFSVFFNNNGKHSYEGPEHNSLGLSIFFSLFTQAPFYIPKLGP